MLAKIAPKFVISRVIQYSHFAESMSVQLLKQPFGTHSEYFRFIDSKNFYEVKFYGYISSLSKPTDFSSVYEQRAYDQATEEFANFNEIYKLVEKITQFNNELKYLYNLVERSITNSNFLSHKDETSSDFEGDVIDALERFNNLVNSLEPYPEWQDKFVEEVGKWFHLIHNNLAESDAKRNIFAHMNRQAYFI